MSTALLDSNSQMEEMNEETCRESIEPILKVDIKEENAVEESSMLQNLLKGNLQTNIEVEDRSRTESREEEDEPIIVIKEEEIAGAQSSVLQKILLEGKTHDPIQETLFTNGIEAQETPKQSRSVATQTCMDTETSSLNCFICNLKTENGVNNAEVQINIASLAHHQTQCNIVPESLIKLHATLALNAAQKEKCIGFHGIKSIESDAGLIDLCGVSFAVFNSLMGHLNHLTGSKMTNKDKLLIFLMKLKLGISYSALSIMFGVHRRTISRAFLSVLDCLNEVLADQVSWLSKEEVKDTFSLAFKSRYPNCRVILDCSEVKIEGAHTVEGKVETYSNDQSAFTVKFFLGCAPNGLITFKSHSYHGRVNDNYIIKDCGLLDLLEAGDIVLVNKGLSGIKQEIESKNAFFMSPPFLTESEISPSEIEGEYRNAFVRIQVQRCIERIRIFHILSLITVELLPRVDAIIHVCCALLNMQKKQETKKV